MMKYFDSDQMIDVSAYDKNGYWTHNESISVQRGLSLPAGCTRDIIQPPMGKTAQYVDGRWGDLITDDRGIIVYLKSSGSRHVCSNVGDSDADIVTSVAPPSFDPETHTAKFIDNVWEIKEILIGKRYYNAKGETLIVAEYDFDLPDNCSFIVPPEVGIHETLEIVDGSWNIIPNFKGVTYWWPNGTRDECVNTGTNLPEGVLLVPPPDPTYLSHDGDRWIRDVEAFKSRCLTHTQINKSIAKDSGFFVCIDGQNMLFDSDANAQAAYLMFATAITQTPAYSVEWKASAGVWVTMDAILFAKVSDGLQAHFAACFAWQKAKEDQINACTNEAELKSISLIYGE